MVFFFLFLIISISFPFFLDELYGFFRCNPFSPHFGNGQSWILPRFALTCTVLSAQPETSGQQLVGVDFYAIVRVIELREREMFACCHCRVQATVSVRP